MILISLKTARVMDIVAGVLDLFVLSASIDGPFAVVWPKNVGKALPGLLFGRSGPASV